MLNRQLKIMMEGLPMQCQLVNDSVFLRHVAITMDDNVCNDSLFKWDYQVFKKYQFETKSEQL